MVQRVPLLIITCFINCIFTLFVLIFLAEMFSGFDTTSIIMCWSLIGCGIMWVMFWPLKVMNSNTGMQSCPTSAQWHSAISAKGNGLMHMNEEGKTSGNGRCDPSVAVISNNGDVQRGLHHRGASQGSRCLTVSSLRADAFSLFWFRCYWFLCIWGTVIFFSNLTLETENKVMFAVCWLVSQFKDPHELY